MIPFLHTPPSSQILCHILINGIIIFTIPTPLILSASLTPALAYVLWQKHTFAVGVRKSMSGGHHGFCRVASPSPRTIYLLLAHVRRFEERTLTKEIEPPGKAALFLSPSPWERDGVRLLLLHQELHDNFC